MESSCFIPKIFCVYMMLCERIFFILHHYNHYYRQYISTKQSIMKRHNNVAVKKKCINIYHKNSRKFFLMSLLKCCAYLQLFIIHSIEQREALDKARGNCALKVIDENLYVLLQYFFLLHSSFISPSPAS